MPVRNRRKTNQAAFTEAELQSAIQIVREGKATVYQAAKDHGINRITLSRYISAGLGTPTSEIKKKTKKRTIFTAEQEKKLSDHILTASKMFLGE